MSITLRQKAAIRLVLQVLRPRITQKKEVLKHPQLNKLSPKVPILSKIAAKIIDPNTGASTWALGNHIWVRYIGVLTKKASIRVKVKIKLVEGVIIRFVSIKFKVVPTPLWVKNIKLNKSGKEAEKV